MKDSKQKRVCPISETTQEVGHALYGASERGWEKGRRRGSWEREGEHCSAHSPPLVLKQQQEEREKESGREGGREAQVRKQRGEQQSASAAGGENGALKSPQPSTSLPLFFFFVLFLFFSGSASVSLLACLWLFCGILTMPGECYPAFHMSLAVLCVLVCWGIMQWEIIFSCVATNRNVDLMLHWDCLRSSALCTVYTPAVPSSSFYACLSVTMQGRLLSWAHTHSLSLSTTSCVHSGYSVRII